MIWRHTACVIVVGQMVIARVEGVDLGTIGAVSSQRL